LDSHKEFIGIGCKVSDYPHKPHSGLNCHDIDFDLPPQFNVLSVAAHNFMKWWKCALVGTSILFVIVAGLAFVLHKQIIVTPDFPYSLYKTMLLT